MNQLTQQQILEVLEPSNIATVNVWLARGDGIAVYTNQDLSSGNYGHRKFMSFGSTDASVVAPPQRMPDSTRELNWRYWLEGVYRGDTLPLPPPILRYTGCSLNSRDKMMGPTLEFRDAPTIDEVLQRLTEVGVSPKRGWRFQYWAVRANAQPGKAEGPYNLPFFA